MNSSDKEMVPFPVIRKRDGRLSRFDIEKVSSAIHKAFYAIGEDDKEYCSELASMVVRELLETVDGRVPHVEEIQDAVERILIRERKERAAKGFILYRDKRTTIREGRSIMMDSVESILAETHKDSHFGLNSPGVKMMKIASAASRYYYLSRMIPSQFAEAHNRGDIHIHDLEYYAKTVHSFQIPVEEMFSKGFYSGYGFIRQPKHISSLSALVAMIIQSCQNEMNGGQSIPAFDSQIARYAQSRDDFSFSREEAFQAMQGLVYNLNMIYSRMGEQVPMSTINLGLDTSPEGRLITEALLNALEEGMGKGETPLFPWVVFHVKDGINYNEDDVNYDLLCKAVKTACRRMNPTFAFADAPVNRDAGEFAYWGDSSRIASDFPFSGEDISVSGRGVIAQVTLNLPRVAFKIAHKRSDFQVKSFFSELRRSLELCARQMLHRRDILSSLRANELPFVMGGKFYSGSQNLNSEDHIEEALNNGFLSLGFIGLWEAMFIMKGRSFAQDEKTLDFALETIDFMRNHIGELSEEFEAPFILSASSSGYAARRFPLLDRAEFSATPYVNDKSYYTQGAGIQASEIVPWEKKLEIEAMFHNKIPGGHFTFLESEKNPSFEQYIKVIRKMKENGTGHGGISFALKESMEDGTILPVESGKDFRERSIRRASGLLLPQDRINEALKDELKQRKPDLYEKA